jgi:hypothetical protein
MKAISLFQFGDFDVMQIADFAEPDVRSAASSPSAAYPRGSDNERVPESVLVSIDISHVGFECCK